MKGIFFLSGLPRSGSTLLGSILSQNPDIVVTPTSPFLDLLCFANQALQKVNQQYTFDYDVVSKNLYKSIFEGFYKSQTSHYVIDKHRGHPRNVEPWRLFLDVNPKIICTVRPIADVLASYLKLIQLNPENNFVDQNLLKNNKQINTTNRAKCLWEEYVSDPYESMVIGLKNHRECLHLVDYDQMIFEPEKTIEAIYHFLQIPQYIHDFDCIHNACAEEKDAAWGLENLHTIRKKLEKTSTPAEEILGKYLTDFYNQYNLIY